MCCERPAARLEESLRLTGKFSRWGIVFGCDALPHNSAFLALEPESKYAAGHQPLDSLAPACPPLADLRIRRIPASPAIHVVPEPLRRCAIALRNSSASIAFICGW